jgi:hypothetical protein
MPNLLPRLDDRINMLKVIPELGLIIAGDQDGQVAILALTKFTQPGWTGCQFRLGAILPFASQYAVVRPRLFGMAVGPIQGQELDQDENESDDAKSWQHRSRQRRYRLILEYTDHTVLSYELGRHGRVDLVNMKRRTRRNETSH